MAAPQWSLSHVYTYCIDNSCTELHREAFGIHSAYGVRVVQKKKQHGVLSVVHAPWCQQEASNQTAATGSLKSGCTLSP